MSETIKRPFGEWLPDQPNLGNPGCVVATNVMPGANGFLPFKSLSINTQALTAYCRGAVSLTDKDLVGRNYAGDATALYELQSGGTWAGVSRTAGYTNATEDQWEFTKFNEKILATNFADAIQQLTLGGAVAADLGGAPPRARHIAALKDFVLVGNVITTSTVNVPERVQWCGINNEVTWTTSGSTLADFQDLEGNGGAVNGIIGGQTRGIVFQERAIWLVSFAGPPIVFQFDSISENRGLIIRKGAIAAGDIVFCVLQDGFYLIQGASLVPVGANKIDRFFKNDFDAAYDYRVSSAVDPLNHIVAWAYPGAGNTGGVANKILLYDWIFQKWAIAELNVQQIYSSMSVGYTLDSLDTLSTSIDALTESLDSSAYVGGTLSFGAFNSANRRGHFNGSALDAIIETGEFEAISGRLSHLIHVRPLVDGGATHTVQVSYRNRLIDSVTSTSTASLNSFGICPVRAKARYHRVRVNISGEFTDAVGVELGINGSSKR